MSKKQTNFAELKKDKSAKFGMITKISIAVLAALVALAVAFVIGNAISTNGKREAETEKVQQVTRSLSGKTSAEDKTDALATVQVLLESTNPPSSQEETQKLLEKIEKGDRSSFDKKFDGLIRYYDLDLDNKTVHRETEMSLLSLAALAKIKNGNIVPNPSAAQAVNLDSETGRAFVPIQAFTGDDTPVAIELVYINGKWQVDPYSFLSNVKLSALIQGGLDSVKKSN